MKHGLQQGALNGSEPVDALSNQLLGSMQGPAATAAVDGLDHHSGQRTICIQSDETAGRATRQQIRKTLLNPSQPVTEKHRLKLGEPGQMCRAEGSTSASSGCAVILPGAIHIQCSAQAPDERTNTSALLALPAGLSQSPHQMRHHSRHWCRTWPADRRRRRCDVGHGPRASAQNDAERSVLHGFRRRSARCQQRRPDHRQR